MCNNVELQQMIMNFRCVELRALLGFAGRKLNNRKKKLQNRALEVLRVSPLLVQMKIQELHRIRTAKKSYNSVPVPATTAPVPATTAPVPATTAPVPATTAPVPATTAPVPATTAPVPATTAPVLAKLASSSAQMPTSRANRYKAKNLNSHNTKPSNSYPVPPDVQFKRLPFYDVLGVLLKPATLVPSSSSRFQENNFMFYLTPQQASDIKLFRDTRPTAKLEYTVQVQLRFCLLETSCEQDDNFPPSICIKNLIPTNKPNVEPKRPNGPVDVTSSCHLSPTVLNHVNVSWASEIGRGYVVGIFLVRRLKLATLLQRLRAQAVMNADHTRALIKEKLTHDADSEIATTSLRVSLLCPLGKMKIQFPCRAIGCSHLQCFDASLYLQMNEKTSIWICPVCDKYAPFDKLVLDGLFMEIFASASESNEIQFHENGSWLPLIPKKEAHVTGSPMEAKPSQMIEASPTKSASFSPPTKKKRIEIVDLTLNSSDEEPEQTEKKAFKFFSMMGQATSYSQMPPFASSLLLPEPKPIPTSPDIISLD